MAEPSDLTPPLITGEALHLELRHRRATALFKTVPKNQVEQAVADGWTILRENKASVRLQKPKPIDKALEDDVWSLLAAMGFSAMSTGYDFRVVIAGGKDKAPIRKQIDVVATDAETILVVECKAAEAVRGRALAKDLGETAGLRDIVRRSIKEDRNDRRHVGWLYVTRNIQWSTQDLGRAAEHGIAVLRDSDLEYYGRLVDLIGPASRHQLQAEVFSGREIRGLSHRVSALRGRAGNKRTFYQFAIEPQSLLKLAFISHRPKLDAESVVTYQRMLRKSRLREIREFIDSGGVFPTNIVVNFRSRRGLRFEPTSLEREGSGVELGRLTLPNTYKSAWIIDGQHRLYGFADTDMATKVQVPVLAFENLGPVEEADMFVEINSKQVKVARSLLVELMGELDWQSEDRATALHGLYSKIVTRLGVAPDSPLSGRITAEGESQSAVKPITVTQLFEALRRSGLVGSVRKEAFYPGYLYERDDLDTLNRASELLGAYLSLFRSALPDHWDRGNAEGGYLCTNNGIAALLLVLRAILDHNALTTSTHATSWRSDEFVQAVAPYTLPLTQHFSGASAEVIRRYRSFLGASGPRLAALSMMQVINASKASFRPEGLDDFIESQRRTDALAARQIVPDLELKIRAVTLALLQRNFGASLEDWWRQAVPGPVRSEMAVRREQSLTAGDLDEYFDLLDYRKIAEANWEIFRPHFAVGAERSKERQLAWFSRLNEIRNRTAHPARRPVSADDVDFVENLSAHFDEQRLQLGLMTDEET